MDRETTHALILTNNLSNALQMTVGTLTLMKLTNVPITKRVVKEGLRIIHDIYEDLYENKSKDKSHTSA